MNCKIYNLSSVSSAPPYFVAGYEDHLTEHMCIWKSKEPQWRKIGEVPSIEIARIMVTQNLAYFSDGKCNYTLVTEPSDEHYCSFVKIESDTATEYYDRYNQSNNFTLRDLDSVHSDYDFSTVFVFEQLRSPIWEVEKAFKQWSKCRTDTKGERQTQTKYAAVFRNTLSTLIYQTETAILSLKSSRQLEGYETERINKILYDFASTFALICASRNEYPFRNKKNISVKKYRAITQKLFCCVDYYNSRHSTKVNNWDMIFTALSKRWSFLQNSTDEKNRETARQKLAEKNRKLKDLFSDVATSADFLVSSFLEWKELYKKINETIADIQQQTDQILSTSVSLVVMDSNIRKEIENSYSRSISAISTFIRLYQDSMDKYQNLSVINIKSLKRSKSRLMAVMDYHI